MAVVKSLPGVKIVICSGEKKLREYKFKTGLSKQSVEKSVRRLIETSTDAEFSIKICVVDTYQLDSPNLLFNIYIDGISVGGVLCGEYELLHGSWTRKVEGIKQPTEKRNIVGLCKFRFSELVIKEDPGFAKFAEENESALRIGEIQVLVHRCSSFHTLPRGPIEVRPDLPVISGKAMEKQQISHGTTYSPTRCILENATIYDVTYVDGEDDPLAVFEFSYRSKDLLKKELLRQAPGSESKPETKEKKRKRTENTEGDEGVVCLSDDDELSVVASSSAGKARKSRERIADGRDPPRL